MLVNYMIAADTDIGTTKSTNQDSLCVKLINTKQGRIVLAVLCDGMGGLEKGEVASASVVRAFDFWAKEHLPSLCNLPLEASIIRAEWEQIIRSQNERIQQYGKRQGILIGTTVAVLLLTEKRYCILNVGDSRVYEIGEYMRQLTKDHTFIAREIELGNMTPEQAGMDPRKNVLLQCVGASDIVSPDFFSGDVEPGIIYLLCSDGFRHEITPDEIYQAFAPGVLYDELTMKQNVRKLIELNKRRQEKDNISAVLIRTF